jgi:hypothetical protein
MITEEQALRRLQLAAEQHSQKTLAERLGISSAYLNDVLMRRRDPSKVLKRFGLKRVVRYEEAT